MPKFYEWGRASTGASPRLHYSGAGAASVALPRAALALAPVRQAGVWACSCGCRRYEPELQLCAICSVSPGLRATLSLFIADPCVSDHRSSRVRVREACREGPAVAGPGSVDAPIPMSDAPPVIGCRSEVEATAYSAWRGWVTRFPKTRQRRPEAYRQGR